MTGKATLAGLVAFTHPGPTSLGTEWVARKVITGVWGQTEVLTLEWYSGRDLGDQLHHPHRPSAEAQRPDSGRAVRSVDSAGVQCLCSKV